MRVGDAQRWPTWATASPWLPPEAATSMLGRLGGRQHAGEGAAHLERAGVLEQLQLERDGAAVDLDVEHWRTPYVRRDQLGRAARMSSYVGTASAGSPAPTYPRPHARPHPAPCARRVPQVARRPALGVRRRAARRRRPRHLDRHRPRALCWPARCGPSTLPPTTSRWCPHDAWWLGTFYGDDARRPFDTYVDVATPAVWHGEDLVRAVDLDLDVIRGTTGRIWVDDEDEFADHRVRWATPTR